MPVQRIDKGIGSQHTFNLNVPFTENIIASTPLTIPTTEPATSQFSYTVKATDFQNGLPFDASVGRTTPLVWIAGQMDTTAGTVSYRLLYNGNSVSTGTTSSITASYYYTLNAVNTNWSANLQVGDVIEMRLWGTQQNTNILYSAIGFYPARLFLSKASIVKDCYWLGNCSPVPTQGTSPTLWGDAFYVYFGRYYTSTRGSGVYDKYSSGNMYWYDNNNSDSYMPYFVPEKNYGFGTVYFGDSGYLTTVTCKTSATNWPYYERSIVPKTISFREIWFDR